MGGPGLQGAGSGVLARDTARRPAWFPLRLAASFPPLVGTGGSPTCPSGAGELGLLGRFPHRPTSAAPTVVCGSSATTTVLGGGGGLGVGVGVVVGVGVGMGVRGVVGGLGGGDASGGVRLLVLLFPWGAWGAGVAWGPRKLRFGVGAGPTADAVVGHLLDVGRHGGLVRGWGHYWLPPVLPRLGWGWPFFGHGVWALGSVGTRCVVLLPWGVLS